MTAAQPIVSGDNAVPIELQEWTQWVAWHPEARDGKTTKAPVNPHTGGLASTTDAATWGTLTEAGTRARLILNGGIGFVFTADDPLCGIDLDGCRDAVTGQIAEWAQEMIGALDSYAEESPSGTGVHVIVRAVLPPGGNRRGTIEMYDRGRFFTVTGRRLPGAPATINERQDVLNRLHARIFPPTVVTLRPVSSAAPNLDDTELLLRARRAKNGEAFRALWGGDASAYGDDESAADLALCGMLNFWTGNDLARTDALFRQSGLMRDKWNRTDYRERTMDKARSQEVYSPPRPDYLRPVDVDPQMGEILDPRVRIDAGNHDLPEVTRQAWDALLAVNDPPYLFQYGGAPVRQQPGEDGRVELAPLTEHRLRCEVALAAGWYVEKGRNRIVVAAEPPLSVIQNMLALAALPLPTLRRIVQTPVFAPDGRLIEATGYDTESGVYLEPVAGLNIPIVPEKPTTDDMKRARALICDDLLGDFPFEGNADKAGAVALLILPFVRDMIDGPTPMHGIQSPTVGSGKSLLADSLTYPAFGSHGETITQARDDDEWRKRIGSKLKEGAALIQIDNVTLPLDSGTLGAALTMSVFSDRRLGHTETFRAPVRCVWVFTANNPTMSTEIARRTIRIRIDPQVDRPWRRTQFRHTNLKGWTAKQRGALVAAALTLVRGWIVAGKPMADVMLGSYEQWAGIMGGILSTAEIDGFLTNLEEFYEAADSEGAAWREFVALWWENHRDKKVGVGDLFKTAEGVDGFDFGTGGDRSQRTAFGAQLARQRDRVFDGYRIVSAGEFRKAKQWRLLPTKGGGCEPPQQRFTQDSPDIATNMGEGVNLCEPFYNPPAEKELGVIYGRRESEKVHRGSHDLGYPLVAQEKNSVNLGLGGSHANDPTDDEAVLYGWVVTVLGDQADVVTDDVRRRAMREGFTFDAFATVRAEAGRLEAHLDQRQAKERTV